MKWTREAGLLCVGIGFTEEEAERPRLFQVGSTRVALFGMDTTQRHFAAAPGRAGSNFAPEADDLTLFRHKVEKAATWARGRCDLLALTIHWGENWVRETPAVHRRMASLAFECGVDLILGHSAHRLQGIEIIRGKPVLYDMGNLLFDCRLSKKEGRSSALFRLHLSPGGVRRIEIVPIEILEGYTRLCDEDKARSVLEEMSDLCAPLGTKLSVVRDGGNRLLGIVEIPDPRRTSRPAVRSEVKPKRFPAVRAFEVPRAEGVLREKVPDKALRPGGPVEIAPGIDLLGFRLSRKAKEGGFLMITTWLRVTKQIPPHRLLAFKAVSGGVVKRRGTPWYTRHDPGDWLLPFSRMRPGEIVEDLYPMRLAGLPPGECEVSVLVIDTTRKEGDRTVGKPFLLGRVTIEPRGR